MTPTLRRRLVVGLVLAALFVVGLVQTHRKPVSELDVYVLGAERMAQGAEIYRPDDAKPFTYPPSFALPFLPFLAVPEGLRRDVWFGVNATALALVVLMLRDLLARFLAARGTPERRTRWLWVATFALAGRHVAAVFENQSHDMLVFLAVTATAWFGARGRDALSGAAAGVGASLKATPLLFAPVFVWQRRFAAAAGVVLSAAFLVWLPDLVLPRADGGSWVMAWYRTFVAGIEAGGTAEAEGAWAAWNVLNQNLAGTLFRLFTPVAEAQASAKLWDVSVLDPGEAGRKALTLAGQAAVFAYVLWCARPSLARADAPAERAFRRLGEAGLVACGMVLLSPMSSKAHFCVLTLPMLYAVVHWACVRRDRVQLALLLLVFATGTLTVKGLVGTSVGNELLARGSVCWHTVLTLWACGRALRSGFGPSVNAATAAS